MGRKSGGTQKVDQTSEVVQHNIPEEFRPYLQKQMRLADALLQEDLHTIWRSAISWI